MPFASIPHDPDRLRHRAAERGVLGGFVVDAVEVEQRMNWPAMPTLRRRDYDEAGLQPPLFEANLEA